ncbi:hypothetical protein CLV58_14123 [Spirosoma oryzae]|uniref:Uncharacterized protein n=1 Tax=Spirosoma oryzae TaxID=1469603 RepID=A0A2T0RQT8_9BACT|nr:hypothetical protein [Spirosoma oryzae]PRY23502.1 hypothetical protein CLV58_14123 [Spirosoma oryzae]
MNDFIDDFLAADTQTVSFDSQQLMAYWHELVAQTDSSAGVAQPFLTTQFLQILASQPASEALDMKTNGWKISVSKSLLKNTLVTATLTTILRYLGEAQLATAVLPTLIPMLFEIEQIELTKKEEEIWLRLPVKKSKKHLKTAEEWYESLPENVRNQIHFLDFIEFLDKLNLAGFADEKHGRYRLFIKGKNKFKITIT